MHKPLNLLVVFIGRRKMVGTLEKLKRALVALIVSLARAYNCGVQINRTSSDEEVRSAYRRLSRCVHPDRPGGNTDDQTRLNQAHDAWKDGCKNAPGRGGSRKPKEQEPNIDGQTGLVENCRDYKIRSEAVLLTYQGLKDSTCWAAFLRFVHRSLAR